MSIEGITQPELIPVSHTIQLRKYDGEHDFALGWYQDTETVYLVDGKKEPYDADLLARMYHYLNEAGELYFIEVLENGQFFPIGDVTLCKEDLPIVIGAPAYRGKGIGTLVLDSLIHRAKSLGFDHVSVGEIYDWNLASRRCFERAGFRAITKTAKGAGYRLDL